MNDKPNTLPPFVINAFFALGLLSAIAFRAIIVIGRIDQGWVRPVWYFAVIGYVFFFGYRYWIACKRRHFIHKYDLMAKLKADEPILQEDRDVLYYLIASLHRSRESWNYLFIFALSIVAVLADLILASYY